MDKRKDWTRSTCRSEINSRYNPRLIEIVENGVSITEAANILGLTVEAFRDGFYRSSYGYPKAIIINPKFSYYCWLFKLEDILELKKKKEASLTKKRYIIFDHIKRGNKRMAKVYHSLGMPKAKKG